MLRKLGIPHLLVAASFLTLSGLVMIYSASRLSAQVQFGTGSVYLWRQLIGLGIGLLAAGITFHLPLPPVRRSAYLFWGLCVLLLVLTLTPIGVSHNGAQRWIRLAGIEFQPLEIAKLGLILALSRWFADHQTRILDYRVAVVTPLWLSGIPALLLMIQPDFGGAMMLLLLCGVLMFATGARITHLGVTAIATLPAVLILAVQEEYRRSRISGFLHPWQDPLGQGYQLVQSLLAFGAGGLQGAGLGAGQQKLGYLPEAHTDFILSVVGEEVGLIGVALVLVAFTVLGLATLGIASRARDVFSKLLVIGAGAMIWLQGLLNGGVSMGVLPTKGTTLPLFSYGRSSLVASLVALGWVLNIARPRQRGRKGWR